LPLIKENKQNSIVLPLIKENKQNSIVLPLIIKYLDIE
jgi:hypothetical protein